MATSIDTIIASRRTALPPHGRPAARFRSYIAAVCSAEVEHAQSDTRRAMLAVGMGAAMGTREAADVAPTRFHFPHEQAAGVALNWLSHVQTHESDVRGPWCRWAVMDAESRAAWLGRYRYLMKGFIRAARAYTAARAQA